MISDPGTNHFHTPDLAVLDEKRFSHENTGGAIESSERVRLSCRQHAGIDRALIEDYVGPNDTTLLVNNRVASIMDVLNDEVITELELRKAIHGVGIDGIRVLRGASTRRDVGG